MAINTNPPVSILCWDVGACFNQSRCNCLTHWAIRTIKAWEGWWLIFICIDVSISGANGYCGNELAAWAITSYRKYALTSCLRKRYCCIPCWFGDKCNNYRNDFLSKSMSNLNTFGYLQLDSIESCSAFRPLMHQYMLLHHSVLVGQNFSYVAGFLHHRLLSMLPMIPNWPRYSLL